uniref:Uncharacterized protein n=1 Tax=Arundo donax TaxID=35708 RepID=A0A0A9AAS9_ARUDO
MKSRLRRSRTPLIP